MVKVAADDQVRRSSVDRVEDDFDRLGDEEVATTSAVGETSSDAEVLPSNIGSAEQLQSLPEEYLSGDVKRPLKWEDEFRLKYTYFLRPMFVSVIYIFLFALLERFSFYGVALTQTNYLTGVYNPDWNAKMTSVQASTYVSISQAIYWTTPFFGGIISDCLLGEYWTILAGLVLLYIPGLLLIALTAVPGLLGDEFNLAALTASMLILYPLGAGAVRSVLTIFGARQYHPKLQSAFVETYYVNLYVSVNIGMLLGGILVPIIAQANTFAAYMIPVMSLVLICVVYLCRTAHYVRMRPNGRSMVDTFVVLLHSLTCWAPRGEGQGSGTKASMPGLDKMKESKSGVYNDDFVDGVRRLLYVFPISALIIPFMISYNQMVTTFIVQGTVMQPAGIIDAAVMVNADPISVLVCGSVVGNIVYPALAEREVKIPTTYKFAIGSFCGSIAMLCSAIIDYKIHAVYEATGDKISIFWLIIPFAFIGLGEIFTISTSLEAAFVVAPKQQKSLASAISLFTFGALSSFICIGLYNGLSFWFEDEQGSKDIKNIEQYSQTKLYNYFWVLFGITTFGALINIVPQMKNWVTYTEEMSRNAAAGAEAKHAHDSSTDSGQV